MESSAGYTTIAEDASVVRVIPGRHRTNIMQSIVTGGIRQGSPSRQVLALAFDLVKQNAVDNYICSLVGYLPELTSDRYMHQSAIVRGKSGSWNLLIMGGKDSNRSWLKSVETLDLLPYFKTGVMKKNEDGTVEKMTSTWKNCQDMKSARANFAMIALQNFVYVYGGISGA